ncbi:D-alanine--D-alanine ligase [Porphyromonas sp. COT-239 OH1446]|uniref:D-alanine--D-alanine ligase n=1 Tax=Porphyromonas sp. COT-239 OH1446 TaxID=1515613 RepID=UPI00052CB974|nr:D-alanine--D-alanine ligase [Porphyromonas sp. COT-239 OH1446]KGN67689.1 D-alanine--D-alanine ligase [Porphyromonas sp. COT-239 OH1446]
MNKPIIAVVAGGYSGEYVVSLRSAQGLMSWIDRELFEVYTVILERERWYALVEGESLPIDRATFGFSHEGRSIRFDYAYITIHGTPGENGLLQGYLDLIGIPYNTGGVLCEALTFNKFVCNRYLDSLPGVRIARARRLHRGMSIEPCELTKELGLPLFVKPNVGGSSVATSRVNALEELWPAIERALEESDDVLLESFIDGTEVTCGCYMLEGEAIALPVTEVVTDNAFFDYDAKYNGQVEEITPARISSELTEHIQQLTRQIYRYTDARGIIRVDYIIEADGLPTLLEVNTTPGMTPTSFIPQQVSAAGLEIGQLLTQIIRQGLAPTSSTH